MKIKCFFKKSFFFWYILLVTGILIYEASCMEEQFWYLLSVKLTGEATSEELSALDKILEENPDYRLQAQMMLQMWQKKDKGNRDTDDFFNRHLQRFSHFPDTIPAIQEHKPEYSPFPEEKNIRGRILKWLIPVSAVAATLIVIVFFINRSGGSVHEDANKFIAQNTVSTRKGSKSNVQLPDGTMAWLNADSKLTYDEHFRGAFRKVTLEGEAFFDVVKDKTRPFIIHTKTLDIRVLGTAFNVRAYETEKNTQTALFRGSVEVSIHNNPEKKIILKPNEKLVVNNQNLLFDKQVNKRTASRDDDADIKLGKVHFQAKDSSALETLWIKNKLVFDAETFEEVAQKLERWYDVKVVIKGNEDMRQATFSAVFDNETLPEVMEALSISGNFKYSINKNTITVR